MKAGSSFTVSVSDRTPAHHLPLSWKEMCLVGISLSLFTEDFITMDYIISVKVLMVPDTIGSSFMCVEGIWAILQAFHQIYCR